MKVAFLLPIRSLRPAGGFKVVYEYANRLTRRGHEVCVVHPWACSPPASFLDSARARLWVARWRSRREAIAPWFEFDEGVNLSVVTHPSVANLPEADILVATAWHTAPWIAEAAPQRGQGAYLIQGYETWDGPVDRVRATWQLPLHKVVISRWLEEIAAELDEAGRTTWVPIGLDLDRLGVDVPVAGRAPRIGALYSSAREKRSADVVAAMVAARGQCPEVGAVFFGTAPRPQDLPDWIDYQMLPSAEQLRALFNSCAIFLQASRSEGWGLPACEAMLCGCALVTVANGGSREFATDRETALVVSSESVDELSDRVVELIRDDRLRMRLATQGEQDLHRYSWERSVGELEAVFERMLSEGRGSP